ncbi:uncharacterized protein E0L32_000611 [Thyridium curvatum]|uniref:Uncharacterized protein n=1 Tax=Thyridium curvatum TaxID=1093900 RepID=A0A507B392_9PEZI|nr:uncharacterized protein E0L32_000611 [Thyridium curvatum]TPX14217.1 hypothetical protein E0L32_000611 [Thyridium curvatum]
MEARRGVAGLTGKTGSPTGHASPNRAATWAIPLLEAYDTPGDMGVSIHPLRSSTTHHTWHQGRPPRRTHLILDMASNSSRFRRLHPTVADSAPIRWTGGRRFAARRSEPCRALFPRERAVSPAPTGSVTYVSLAISNVPQRGGGYNLRLGVLGSHGLPLFASGKSSRDTYLGNRHYYTTRHRPGGRRQSLLAPRLRRSSIHSVQPVAPAPVFGAEVGSSPMIAHSCRHCFVLLRCNAMRCDMGFAVKDVVYKYPL